jgi:hypothetical protein
MNDVMYGAILVYDVDGTAEAFIDNYQTGSAVSFNFLAERQFKSMATFLANSLNRIYGTSDIDEFNISGYGAEREVDVSKVIDNTTQKAIAGLSSDQITNKSNLNYRNAINGGYDLVDNGDGTYSYDTDTTLSANKWKGASFVSVEQLTKALAYIYLNQIGLQNVSDDSYVFKNLTFDNDSFKKHYSEFSLPDEIIYCPDHVARPLGERHFEQQYVRSGYAEVRQMLCPAYACKVVDFSSFCYGRQVGSL